MIDPRFANMMSAFGRPQQQASSGPAGARPPVSASSSWRPPRMGAYGRPQQPQQPQHRAPQAAQSFAPFDYKNAIGGMGGQGYRPTYMGPPPGAFGQAVSRPGQGPSGQFGALGQSNTGEQWYGQRGSTPGGALSMGGVQGWSDRADAMRQQQGQQYGAGFGSSPSQGMGQASQMQQARKGYG